MPDDLAEFLDIEPYPITVHGKTYEVPPLDWPTGLLVADIMAGKKNELDGKPTHVLYARLLGGLWDQMIEDGVPFAAMARAGEIALSWFTQGREVADAVREGGISPEALAAAKAATQNPADSKPSNRTGAARKTPTRASTSGTSTRPATQRRSTPPKAKA